MASSIPNRVYLSCIPLSFTNDQIENMVREYGNVINLQQINRSSAFVTYQTAGEAEIAVRKIGIDKNMSIRAKIAYERKRDDSRKSESVAGNRSTISPPSRSKAQINGFQNTNFKRSNSSIDDFRKGSGYCDRPASSSTLIKQTEKLNLGGDLEWDLKMNGFQSKAAPTKAQSKSGNEYKIGAGKTCVGCFRIAEMFCERCADYYCSIACQKKDWNNHRIICFPMPRLLLAPTYDTLSGLQTIEGALQNSVAHLVASRAATKENNGDKNQSRNSINEIDVPINKKSVDSNNQLPVAMKAINDIGRQSNAQLNSSVLESKTNNEMIKKVKPDDYVAEDANNNGPTSAKPSPSKQPANKTSAAHLTNGIVKNVKSDDSKGSQLISPKKSLIASPSANDKTPVKNVKADDSNESKLATPSTPLRQRSFLASRNTPNNAKPAIPESEPISCADKVVISSVSDIHSVYVRPEHANESFQKIIGVGVGMAKSGKRLTELPETNDLVMAPYENRYYRAAVIKVEPKIQPILVAFIDFGNAEEVKFDDIREIGHELAACKKVITKIKLKPIPEQLKADEVLSFLDTAVEKGITFTIQFDSPIKEAACDLILPNGKSYIDEILAVKSSPKKKKPLATIPEVAENSNVVYQTDINAKIVNGRNVNVTLINNDFLGVGLITIIQSNDEQVFIENEEKIKLCGQSLENSSPYKPVQDEVCLFKDALGNWYRGEWETTEMDYTFTMHSIDFGIYEQVAAQNIRQLPKELAFPAVSFICMIEGFNEGAYHLNQFYEKIPLFDNFIVESIKYDADEMLHMCKIPAILAAIRKA